MKYRVEKRCFWQNALREPGDVVSFEDGVVPPYFTPIDPPREAVAEADKSDLSSGPKPRRKTTRAPSSAPAAPKA